LVINKKHQEDILKIITQESQDLFKLLQWVTKKYQLPGGGIFMRFGQTNYSGASVTHLHAHLITGGKKNNKNKENYLNAPLGYHI
jgi:diadenosine tetraphosphate (Ap4A) HIT family hydrolase